MQSSSSKTKKDLEEVLELDSEGDIISRKQKVVVPATLRPGHKNYFSTQMALDKSDVRGESKFATPPPLKTLLGEDGLNCSDAELVKQSLIAWRQHLRSHGEYKPDGRFPNDTHLTHAKILMAALSNFKVERTRNQLTPRAKLFYKHDRYSVMYKSYHVPADTWSPYELMSKVDSDRDILYRLRCAPLNAFYSMLMEDTPGYVPSNIGLNHQFKNRQELSLKGMTAARARHKAASLRRALLRAQS